MRRVEIYKNVLNFICINNKKICTINDIKFFKACLEFTETPIDERGELLDEAEKEYLSALIKPFRDRVDSIAKSEEKNRCGVYEYLTIRYNDDLLKTVLPNFKKGTMYKGMKQYACYSIEELEL